MLQIHRLQGSNTEKNYRAGIRTASSVVAIVLALMAATLALPPLVTARSDRAVVNAPLVLLTAPISGEVQSVAIEAGGEAKQGEALFSLENARVDRSTAIQLSQKISEMKERIIAIARKRESNQAYVQELDAALANQVAQVRKVWDAQLAELKASLGAAASVSEERRGVRERFTKLFDRQIVSGAMLQAPQRQLESAEFVKDAVVARILEKTVQLDGLSRGVYVGDETGQLADLAKNRRDLEFDTQRMAIEESELKSGLEVQQRLLDAESKRIGLLSAATVAAPFDGKILQASISEGRHVNAGDALASLVDCDRAFVVGIFSYREAPDFQVGARVAIDGLPSGGGYGVVTEVKPRSSESADQHYAVPFPQTERRELYVVARFESDDAEGAAAAGRETCLPGRWVTLSRSDARLPSVSGVWRNLRRAAGFLVTHLSLEPEARADEAHEAAATGSRPDLHLSGPRLVGLRQAAALRP
jgi:multidrug resistance efflux pump